MNVHSTITSSSVETDGMQRLPVVFIKDGEARTNSRDVAGYFERQHKDVLRAVDNLGCSVEFHRRNFAPVLSDINRPDGSRIQVRSIDMTKDGFTFLVMGFTGKAAARFKEAYIQRFNEMERALRTRFNEIDEDEGLPAIEDRYLFGMPVSKVRAAVWSASVAARLAGEEAGRLVWAKTGLPDIRKLSVGHLAGKAHSDPIGCFRHLMRAAAGNGKSISQILSLAMHDKATARAAREYGFVLGPQEARDCLAIANRHRFLASVFADTQWCEQWRLALAQLPGARPSRGAIGFGGGNARAVLIPRSSVLDLLNPAGLSH